LAGDLEVVDDASGREVALSVFTSRNPCGQGSRVHRPVGFHITSDREILDLRTGHDLRVEDGEWSVRSDVPAVGASARYARIDQNTCRDLAVENPIPYVQSFDVLTGFHLHALQASPAGSTTEYGELSQVGADHDVIRTFAMN